MTLIKEHLRRYQIVYISTTSSILVAGVTWFIMKGCHANARGVLDGPVKVTVQPFSFFSKQENAIVTTINRGGTGSPSYIVECLESGEAWLSQRQAAVTKGVTESVLSGHLNGKFPDADGLHYRRIGVATA